MTDVTLMPIDELARRSGLTTRNIRAYQSRGLLPGPRLRGRIGFYGPEHEQRLALIRELQEEGFNLDLIGKLIERAGGSTEEVVRFTRALRRSFADEEPHVIDARELSRRWGGADDPQLMARAVELGLLRPLDDGRVEQPSPRLAHAGAELAALGVSPEHALEVLATMRAHAAGVADAFVALFLDEIWEPFDRAGRPAERWGDVRDALERLRPLASDAMLTVFQQVMDEAVDAAVGRELMERPEGHDE